MPFNPYDGLSSAQTELDAEVDGHRRLIAYRLTGIPSTLVPATADRPWMGANGTTFANRCLPMRIANQDGWFILNPCAIRLQWNGGPHQDDLTIEVLDGLKTPALSHFGHGIVTWWIPFLFRTPPGYNMHVRGPVNFCKDGISPLNAIVETDWAMASFPMSWKVTRAGHPVRFEKDEPICMISPLQRGSTEFFLPEILPLATNETLAAGHGGWSESRRAHNESLRFANPPKKWEKHYFVGTHPRTEKAFQDHQVRLQVKPFAETGLGRGAPETTETDELPFLASKEAGLTTTASGVSCPFSSGIQADAVHAAPGTPLVEVSRVADFFWRTHELQSFASRWFTTGPGRADVAKPAWAFEFEENRHSLLSCDPFTVFPADLVEELRQRLESWGASQRLGALQSLQVSLFVHGSFRKPAKTEGNLYFALPLQAGADLRSAKLVAECPQRGVLGRLLPRSTSQVLSPVMNELLAFPSSLRAGVDLVSGSPDPRDGTILLEGTFGADAQGRR